MDLSEPPASPPISTTLRRRNSIGATPSPLTVPSNHHYHRLRRRHPSSTSSATTIPTITSSSSSSSSPSRSSSDFELVSIKPTSYTSLKDILPSSASAAVIQSPKTPSFPASQSCCEISIRNRLVKQAAWAYLQPMSSSPETEPSFILRLWTRFSNGFLRLITGAFDCLLRSIRTDPTR